MQIVVTLIFAAGEKNLIFFFQNYRWGIYKENPSK